MCQDPMRRQFVGCIQGYFLDIHTLQIFECKQYCFKYEKNCPLFRRIQRNL